jgi:NTE family protein
MKLKIITILCSIIVLAAQAFAAENVDSVPRPAHQSVGLVLSGGGAKGIAHIGVIQALEDNNIPIDYIAGTSMGAIVGGLYAAGYTPAEMLQLIQSRSFGYWSTGKIDPRLNYYFNRETPTPAMMTVSVGANRDSVAASLISPLPMNFAFMELFSAYTAQCNRDFDKLFVPYRCVASNVEEKRKEVLRGGSLGDAIRASMSFPIVFQPTMIDSVLLYDGGIYDNFPVDVMRTDFAPSIMLGVSVSGPSTGPQTSLVDQIENLVIQNNDYNLPEDEGIKMRIKLSQFGLLDFAKAQTIYEIGYNKAMEMMDSIKSRITTRSDSLSLRHRRAVFKSKSPYLRFSDVDVTGGTRSQNEYIRYLFSNDLDTIGIAKARDAYYRAASSGKFKDLQPEACYNDTTGLFDLKLRASIKDDFKVGFGGYLTSSSNSYIFVSAGYSTLKFNSMSANINAWVGQSYYAAMFNSRIHLRTDNPSAIALEGVASRRKYYEDDKLFFKDKQPAFVTGIETFGRLKWAFAAGRTGMGEIGVGGGRLKDSYISRELITDDGAQREALVHNLGQVFAKYQSSTLDNENFPTSGAKYSATAMGVLGRAKLSLEGNDVLPVSQDVKWLQFESVTRNYLSLSSRWTLGLESNVMLSTRKLLPDYNASLISAPQYAPTPAADNVFNTEFRANNYLAAGVIPIFSFMENLSARVGGYVFVPMRTIYEMPAGAEYGKWFDTAKFFGEADITYQFPFGTLNAYCNYCNTSTHSCNVGISFGIYLHAPKLLR